MKLTTLALLLMTGFGTGCAIAPAAREVSLAALPDCSAANYDRARALYTMMNAAPDAANQQCLLTVGDGSTPASPSRLAAGNYAVTLANGGGGGAGGTAQGFAGQGEKGGGGGGGAGAREIQAVVRLTPGVYKLTLGAGGPGGNACMPAPFAFGGGPGWAGSPSSIVRVATGEVLLGAPGADSYVRPTRRENEKAAGPNRDGHGGSGPGQTSGGDGGHMKSEGIPKIIAEEGDSKTTARGTTSAGGAAGFTAGDVKNTGGGGGGGATSKGEGGDGGGATARVDIPPERGALGSGGGGGEGNSNSCDAGAPGGNGYIALRRI